MAIKKDCSSCGKSFTFRSKITGFKDGMCRECYCKDGELHVDVLENGEFDLYYLDDDGYRNPATLARVRAFEAVFNDKSN